MKNLIYLLITLISLNPHFVWAAPTKVLVVLSSENHITLKNGINHPTGFFLSELMVPLIALQKAGFEPVFATPKGNVATLDKISDKAYWFDNNEAQYQAVKKALAALSDFQHPMSLRQVRGLDPSEFAGIFLPGGHAPMQDLLKDKDLGAILKYFHAAHKPTALICHAPIALLATLANGEEFLRAAEAKSWADADKLSRDFIYRGYHLTSFSTKEEQQEEPGQDGNLGGFVKFYPDEALGGAGARAVVNAIKWRSNVIVDRELITGENPFSDHELAQAFVRALISQSR